MLKELGVKFNSKTTKEELEALLAEAQNGKATEQEVATIEAIEEPTKEDKKAGNKQKVIYANYTSKKNLLKDHPNMETANNQTKIFHNGFTYSITEDEKYVAVTYYYSKGQIYKYALASLDNNMQVNELTYKNSIKEVKAAIKAIYYPEAQQEQKEETQA